MRGYGILAAVMCLGLASAILVPAQDAKSTSEQPAQIKKLIDQLSSPSYVQREKARMELDKIGPAALPALKEAIKNADQEVSKSAAALVEKMEAQQQTAKLLAPKLVHLKVQDVPISEAIKQLNQLSGYTIQLQGDINALQRRRITVDTGKPVPFWEAFDLLCEKAGLSAVQVQNSYPPNNYPYIKSAFVPAQPGLPIMAQPPVQIQPKKKGGGKKALHNNGQPGANGKGGAGGAGGIGGAGGAAGLGVQINQQPAAIQQQIAAQQAKLAAAQAQLQAIQLKAVAVQVQAAQPAQPAFQPVQKFKKTSYYPNQPNIANNNGPILVQIGQPAKADPVCYSGAARIQLSTPAVTKDEVKFLLKVMVEPGLDQFSLSGTPLVEKAVDEHGQLLDMIVKDVPTSVYINQYNGGYYNGIHNQPKLTQMQVHLKPGQKTPHVLKELKGQLSAQMLLPAEPLLIVKDVMKGPTKPAAGPGGGNLIVQNVRKTQFNTYEVDVHIDNPPGMNNIGFGGFGGNGNIIINGNVMINGNAFNNNPNFGSLVLVDSKGKPFQYGGLLKNSTMFAPGKISRQMTVQFTIGPNQGEPDQLMLVGRRMATVNIPFHFKNVTLQ